MAAEIWNEWDCAIATTDALISAKLKQKTALLSKTFLSARDVSTSPSAGWRHTPISELARVCGGGTPDTSKPAYWGGAVAWCTPTDITSLQSRWLDATERTLTEAGLAACSAEVLPVGSVVLCSRASVGACAIARIPVATNQGFQSLVPLRKHDTHFLYYLVQAVARRLLRISGGSTFLEFPGGELSKLIVAAPGPAERDRIGSAFGAIDDEIDLLAAQADALRVQKRGLMQKLLTDEWELSAAKVPEAAE
ncbi:MAG TPA: restriction endonuclease subunit S [Sphingomicrobium sp.]|nr:restriction endonuclease subunit S [Sphingomicrobium sp.]